MANHLTPTELARESGLGRREVLSKCLEQGVPIFKGRIDKSLFLASLRQGSPQHSAPHTQRARRAPATSGAEHKARPKGISFGC